MHGEPLARQGPAGELLDRYWAPEPEPFSRRGLIGELVAAAAFLAAAVAVLVVVDVPARAPAHDVVLLVAAYAVATQVRFELGASFVLPTQLLLVPLLFLAPLGAVPLLLGGAMAVGAAVQVARRTLPPDRILSAVADGWHLLGPVTVLAVAGSPEPQLGHWWLYVAAFAAQILVEGVVLALREWVDRGIPPLRHALALGEGHAVDALLAPVGLLAALAGVAHPSWALLPLPLIGLLALVDRERRQRIRLSQARLAALGQERARGEAALARIGEAMAARVDGDALVDLAVRSAVEVVAADGARFLCPDDSFAAAAGVPVEGALAAAVIAEARDHQVLAAEAADGSAVMAAPLLGAPSRPVLACVRAGDPFGPDERQRLLTLVAQLGAALQTAETHERLRREALTDELTGLANHRRFQELLSAAVARSADGSARPALVLIDLDDFKAINDTHGHQTGDLVLRAVGRCLLARCRAGDEPARYGGEELAVVLGDTTPAQASAIAERLRRDVEALTLVAPDGTRVQVTASFGVAVHDRGIDTPAALIAAADSALYEAKAAGKNRLRAAAAPVPARRVAPLAPSEVAADLLRGIARGELELHYQPKVALDGRAVVGVEALARWHHPERGLLGPATFVPAAEGTAAMPALTRWVMREALAQSVTWRRAGLPLPVAVNISAHDLDETRLPALVAELLDEARARPGDLRLEVTEHSLISNGARARAALAAVRESGVGVSLDDFGAGYSSLSRLRDLPVDELKLDRGLLPARHRPADLAILRAAIALGHDLGLTVLAEGIEDDDHWRTLAALGCRLAQGWHIAPALRPAEISGWIGRWAPGAPAPTPY